MEWKVWDSSGQEIKKIHLVDAIFDVPMNEPVLHQVVLAYRANRRQGTHATKTRSLVSGGGKKPFKQKGTGNARQGSSRSPLMPGGGVCHGPQPRSYSQKINKKVKVLSVKVALSDKVRHASFLVVQDFAWEEYSTKRLKLLLEQLGVKNRSVLLADERKDVFLQRSIRNVYKARMKSPLDINAEDILGHEVILISEHALEILTARLSA